jgi:hypothetical protein
VTSNGSFAGEANRTFDSNPVSPSNSDSSPMGVNNDLGCLLLAFRSRMNTYALPNNRDWHLMVRFGEIKKPSLPGCKDDLPGNART